jgi:hypothetical protein
LLKLRQKRNNAIGWYQLLARLKFYQTLGSLLFLPLVYYQHSLGYLSDAMVAGSTVGAILGQPKIILQIN